MEIQKRIKFFASSIVVSCAVMLLIEMLKFFAYRKRKAQRQSSASIPVAVLDLGEDEPKSKQGT